MSDNLGMGVMIGMLGGNESSALALRASVGKEIATLALDEEANALRFTFTDGASLTITDQGQSCCESRYMRTDDDLSYHIGATFVGAAVKDAPPIEAEYETHEVQFLDITTSRGTFQMANHNEHNGYYGGFWMQASATEAAPKAE